MSIALGHPAGVRNIFVVFAIRFGNCLGRTVTAPTRRPRSSVPDSCCAVWVDCAVAAPAHMAIPAPSNSLLPIGCFIALKVNGLAPGVNAVRSADATELPAARRQAPPERHRGR